MSVRSWFGLVLIVLAGGFLALWYLGDRREYMLSIAAGQKSEQAFRMVKAIQLVTHRHYPEIKIEVYETRGSLQNARLLDSGAVDLATTQADLVFGRRAQLVAELYPDAFQLVARRESGIRDIGDLVGKRVALPPDQSGEYESFWFLASHYDLTMNDLEIFPGTEATTDWLMINGDVDALFRVRAAGDASVLRLIDELDAEVIAIPQAGALRLKQPSLEVGVIPEGSYNGRPAIPQRDLPTVSVKRLLVAREDVPDEVISKLTSILFERRRELIDLVPLAGSITAPNRSGGTFLPIHAGAQAFYDRDQPSFLQANAEALALAVSIVVVFISGLLQLASRRRKRVMDGYNRELLELAQRARKANSFQVLDQCQAQLADFVGRIVQAAELGNINAQEFNLFNFTYYAVEDAIRDREVQMERAERNAAGTRRNSMRRVKGPREAAS